MADNMFKLKINPNAVVFGVYCKWISHRIIFRLLHEKKS